MPCKVLILSAIHVFTLGLMACGKLPISFAGEGNASPPTDLLAQRRPVQTILNAPTVGKVVALQGQVAKRVPLLGSIVYELRDDSGSIWVLTKDVVPNQGDIVLVAGKVSNQTIQLNGKEQRSIYLEQSRVYPTSSQNHSP